MNKNLPKKINPLVNQIFPDEDLKQKYKVKKIIGKGQFGYVAKAIQKKTNQFVAIKKIINLFQNASQTKRILRQIILLKNCRHPNIVSLIQVLIPHNQTVQNFDKIYIVTEYCDTDLRKLFQMEETYLQIDDVKYILYQIACGIKYLHSASIIHRDLTPSNILINGQGMKIKICDLGLARVVEHKNVENQVEQSEDQESLQNQVKKMIVEEKEANKKQNFNPYKHIETQSFSSISNTENKSLDQLSEDSQGFFRERKNTNQSLKKTLQKVEKDQKNEKKQFSIVNFEESRGIQRSQQQIPQGDKKKKGLRRMNSSVIERPGLSKLSQKLQGPKSPQTPYRQGQEYLEQGQNNQKKQLKKHLPSNPIAKLTLRVTTRWYRAPQIILLEKVYSKPIDIWSLGCLFGELLKMMKSVCVNPTKRFPLFPGKHCYPVSPATLCNINRQKTSQEGSANFKNDQLFMILSTIGKPQEQDLEFLTDEGAKEYIRSMQNFERKDFKKFFSSVPDEAIQILQSTLLFDPNKRLRIDDIINHPFLEKVKNKQLEKEGLAVIMEFEQNQSPSLELFKKYLANEIKSYLI